MPQQRPPSEQQQTAELDQHITQPRMTLWARTRAKALGVTHHPFVAKIKADDLPRLAPMIAFNLLMSLVPIMVLILVLVGFGLSGLAPHARDHLITLVSARTSHGQFFKLALYKLTSMASWAVALIVVLPSVWFGSELFVVIEHCFTRIFLIAPRPFVHQRLMALRMLGVFVLLIPLLIGVASLPFLLKRGTMQAFVGNSPLTPILFLLATLLVNWLVAASFFFVIYLVIPNGHVHQVWKGTLIAGGLLAIYMVAFPHLEGGDLSAKSDATNAGFALAAIAFFYFFSLFLLLGAEINAYWGGMHHHQRPRGEPTVKPQDS